MGKSPFTSEERKQLHKLLLNKRFHPNATVKIAGRALAELTAIEQEVRDTWIPANANFEREGHSPFVRPGMSRDNQLGLQRIAKLSARLRSALTETGAGHVYVRLAWRGETPWQDRQWRETEKLRLTSWRALLEDLHELERLALEKLTTRSRKRVGTPGHPMHRSLAVRVGYLLDRLGYRVSKQDDGHYARVLDIMFAAADLPLPNLRKLVSAFHEESNQPHQP